MNELRIMLRSHFLSRILSLRSSTSFRAFGFDALGPRAQAGMVARLLASPILALSLMVGGSAQADSRRRDPLVIPGAGPEADVTGSSRLPRTIVRIAPSSEGLYFPGNPSESDVMAGAPLETSFASPRTAPPPELRPLARTAAYNSPPAQYYAAPPSRGAMGGGLIEALFSTNDAYDRRGTIYNQPQPMRAAPEMTRQAALSPEAAQPRRSIDPAFMRAEVEYDGREAPGTLVIDTPNKYLYLVRSGGRATRYGIGVGRPGFTWSGVKHISRKAEWPDWTPPPEMLRRRPDLPRHMSGGPDNPLGARALYLGSSLYRIHGTNEPHTIGQNVSSGCIRMMNDDVADLYDQVRVGARVIVM